jgi:hypothetical protein
MKGINCSRHIEQQRLADIYTNDLCRICSMAFHACRQLSNAKPHQKSALFEYEPLQSFQARNFSGSLQTKLSREPLLSEKNRA